MSVKLLILLLMDYLCFLFVLGVFCFYLFFGPQDFLPCSSLEFFARSQAEGLV